MSGHTGRVTSVGFSGDGSKVVSGSYDQTVKIWSADNGEVIKTLSGDIDMKYIYYIYYVYNIYKSLMYAIYIHHIYKYI